MDGRLELEDMVSACSKWVDAWYPSYLHQHDYQIQPSCTA